MTAALIAAAEAEGETVIGTRISATAPVTDQVGTADPFEHVPAWLRPRLHVLRDPIEALRGDPDELNAHAAQLRSAAHDLRSEASPRSATSSRARPPWS